VADGAIGRELYGVRNFRQPYQKGLVPGMLHTALQMVTRGRGVAERYPAVEDHRLTRRLAQYGPERPAPAADGRYVLDRMSDVYLSATRHDENQPPHLLVLDTDICRGRCREEFGNPCTSFCPAGVYELAAAESGPRLHLNFSNCVHCKVCDIADPYGIIVWTAPEGGDGPRYRST
jgi:electron-transferring-flavoprotein dehydrogenase